MKQYLKTLLAYFIITFVWATHYNEVLFDNALSEMAVGGVIHRFSNLVS
jgi:hypothetical protein